MSTSNETVKLMGAADVVSINESGFRLDGSDPISLWNLTCCWESDHTAAQLVEIVKQIQLNAIDFAIQAVDKAGGDNRAIHMAAIRDYYTAELKKMEGR